MHSDHDVELRSIDPSTNRFRLFGLTECRTLFGELCLRIVWGRLGSRRLRERSEVFSDRGALERRRRELLARRRRHGYVDTRAPAAPASAPSSPAVAVDCAILEAHGLRVEDRTARGLVARWHSAVLALVRYAEARGAGALDLIDASTLAGMFVNAAPA